MKDKILKFNSSKTVRRLCDATNLFEFIYFTSLHLTFYLWPKTVFGLVENPCVLLFFNSI